jgi:MOSC domain-containing protein YiiM
MTTIGRLEFINTSRGGVPKLPLPECRVTTLGLEGDRHNDTRYHGGPDRAVTLFALERIDALRGEGHPIAAGTIGENLTVSGLDWDAVVPGARLQVGGVLLEVTKHTTPCVTIAGAFTAGDYGRVSQKIHPGWSRVCARVLEEGLVRVGDSVCVVAV